MLPLVITVSDAQRVKKSMIAYVESPVFVGRSELSELQLLEPWIQRTEGVLEFTDDGITYSKQGDANCTTINGVEIDFSAEVPAHGELVISRGRQGSADEKIHLRFARQAVPEGLLWHAGPRDERAVAIGQAITATLDANALAQAPASKLEPPAAETPSALARDAYNAAHLIAFAPTELATPAELDTPSSASRRLAAPESEPDLHDGLDALHQAYRQSWSDFHRALAQQLQDAAPEGRAQLANRLQRRFPQISREPTFREVLKAFGLRARRPDDPDVEDWLKRIAGVLPGGFRLERGFDNKRLLELIDAYTKAFVDLNAAQQTVRRRWLGKGPAAQQTLLQSDDPNIVLAHLLYCGERGQAWSVRCAELQQEVKQMVSHEWALMQATMEGARELLESLAPTALAQAEGVALPEREASRGRSLWPLRAGSGAEVARLWWRFVEAHQALLDGDRYQRVFTENRFAKRYNAAMRAAKGAKQGKQ